jgi:hypothetical protein
MTSTSTLAAAQVIGQMVLVQVNTEMLTHHNTSLIWRAFLDEQAENDFLVLYPMTFA